MFPQPAKVVVDNKKICIIQPHSAHQLALWGQAARNCVGSSSYSSKIKAKKHFILMIMVDNKPRYTVQMTLSADTLKVSQIKDVGNRTLSTDEKTVVETALTKALTARAKDLADALPEPEPVAAES